jgi:hypothetical protein
MLVGLEVAELEPPAPVAVTIASILSPISPDWTVYVEFVWLVMLKQRPLLGQSCH